MTEHLIMPKYTPAGWRRLRAVADDRDDLQDSLADYDRKAHRIAGQFAARGFSISWLSVDAAAVDEMVQWCHTHGYRVDQAGRAAYGAVRSAELSHSAGRA